MAADIAIRVCCGGAAGSGHINRVLIIAKHLSRAGYKLDVLVNKYGTGCETPIEELKNLSRVRVFNFEYLYLEKLYSRDAIPKIVIYDISSHLTVKRYLSCIGEEIKDLRNSGRVSIVYDGAGKGDSIHRNMETLANYIIIPYPVEPELFRISSKNSFLYGLEYFICSEDLINLQKTEVERRKQILVFLSNRRDINIDREFYKVLEEQDVFKRISDYKFVFLSNRKFTIKRASGNVELRNLISHEEFLKELARSSLLITSTGLAKYEALFLNVPVIVYLIDDEMEEYHRYLEGLYGIKCVSRRNSKGIYSSILQQLSGKN